MQKLLLQEADDYAERIGLHDVDLADAVRPDYQDHPDRFCIHVSLHEAQILSSLVGGCTKILQPLQICD